MKFFSIYWLIKLDICAFVRPDKQSKHIDLGSLNLLICFKKWNEKKKFPCILASSGNNSKLSYR